MSHAHIPREREMAQFARGRRGLNKRDMVDLATTAFKRLPPLPGRHVTLHLGCLGKPVKSIRGRSAFVFCWDWGAPAMALSRILLPSGSPFRMYIR